MNDVERGFTVAGLRFRYQQHGPAPKRLGIRAIAVDWRRWTWAMSLKSDAEAVGVRDSQKELA